MLIISTVTDFIQLLLIMTPNAPNGTHKSISEGGQFSVKALEPDGLSSNDGPRT